MKLDKLFERELKNQIRAGEENQAGHPLTFAAYTLSDNQELLLSLCNTVAQQTPAFMSEATFTSVPQKTLTKPTPPSVDDPQFLPSEFEDFPADLIQKYGREKVAKVAAARRYQLALQQHGKEAEKYQRLRVQTQFIRDDFPRGRVAYLDYVFEALRVLSGEPHKLAIPHGVALHNLAFQSPKQTDSASLPTLPTLPPHFVDQFFFTPKIFGINEQMRWRHTFICGATGSGKSQTILNIVRHYLTANTAPAVVVFDPHGKDLALPIARMREFENSDRLLYIDLRQNFRSTRRVSFNPFDCVDKSEHGLNDLQIQLTSALGPLFQNGLTENMTNVLKACIGVLLHRDGSTFEDLYRFMDDEQNADLIKYGQDHLPNPFDREFFKTDFIHNKTYTETKTSLRRRFTSLVRDPDIRAFLCQPSTFDLEDALESGKIIVLNCQKGILSKDAVKTIGQLLTARISGYAVNRYNSGKTNVRRIHLIADECQYFANEETKEILAESRKYSLHLTLATQTLEQLGANERSVIDMVIANCGTFHVGSISGQTAGKLAEVMNVPKSELSDQPNLGFYIYERGGVPMRCVVPFVGAKHNTTQEKWENRLRDQWSKYYRPTNQTIDPTSDYRQQAPLSPPPASIGRPQPKFGQGSNFDKLREANAKRKAGAVKDQ